MGEQLRPYRFVPQLKHVIWGGTRIGAFKGIDLGGHTHVGESWELCGLPGHESVVADGPEAGLTLPELIARHGEDLVGSRVVAEHGTLFPLLFKFIDANSDLSVQIHPGDEMARRLHGCMGKSEMWYVIEADPGAAVVAGLRAGHNRQSVTTLTADHRVMEALAMFDSHAGDVFDLPAGSVHMIGAGNLIAEVQQASDITYRLWDYDRVDSDGKRRELHTELALKALAGGGGRAVPRQVGDGVSMLVSNDAFAVTMVTVNGERRLGKALDECQVLMCVDGEGTLTLDGALPVTIARGDTLLVPAAARAMTFNGNLRMLATKVK